MGGVFVMENHDEAYRVWRQAGVRRRVLVHIDAHHDMWWKSDATPVHIANFLCPALREDLVRELYWVVPDASWQTPRARRAILRHLREITKDYPGRRQPVRLDGNQASTQVLGKPLRVCSLPSLPRLAEPVLLDIDVDFLVIPHVSHGVYDRPGALPWCWPEDLLARLNERDLHTDLVTLAYSVEGGYTPLGWKYLGDELALRLRQPGSAGPPLQGMERLRAAAVAAHRGDQAAAEAHCREAGSLLPDSAAPDWHLAQLYARTDRLADARACYRRALARDPSYRTAYNGAGFVRFWEGSFDQAEQEYRRVLTLDPDDAPAHLGMGLLAVRKKAWGEAETWLRKAAERDGRLLDAYRLLGKVLARQGRHAEAISAYERSLKLGLAGCKSLTEAIATGGGGRSPTDTGHCRTHARLARLYALQGATARAITAYRMSIAGGHDGVALRAHLAALYLKQRQWRGGLREAGQALRRIPESLGSSSHALRRWLASVRWES